MSTEPMIRAEDVEEAELARVDLQVHEAYGRDESTWKPWQWSAYYEAINTVKADFVWEAAS